MATGPPVRETDDHIQWMDGEMPAHPVPKLKRKPILMQYTCGRGRGAKASQGQKVTTINTQPNCSYGKFKYLINHDYIFMYHYHMSAEFK